MKKLLVIILVGMAFLESCENQHSINTPKGLKTLLSTVTPIFTTPQFLPDTAYATKMPTQTATISPVSQRFTVTLTPLSTGTATVTATATLRSLIVTPTLLSVSRQKYRCLDIKPILPTSTHINGTIVFTPAYPDDAKQIYLWNMETNTQKSLLQKNEANLDLAISPDRKWLAYHVGTTQSKDLPRIVIINAEGQQQKVIPGESGWYSISRWIDNQRIVIRGIGNITAESIVINPFTGEHQELPPLQPDINSMFPPPDGSMISYDPTLTYIVYPDMNFQTVLENLGTHKILARVETVWEAVPRWSPDGQRFIIASQIFSGTVPIEYDLYSIDLQGQIQRLTQLSNDRNYIERTSYYWSPDGRYIAMWVITDPKQKNRNTMAILDTTTQEVVNYCITNKHISKFPPPLIWSPDGQQLLMEIDDENNENMNHIVVVDIQQGWAAQIAEDKIPVGWMTSP